MGHKQMGSCEDRPPKCIICTGPHKVEKHCCGVAGCIKRRGEICVHVTAKCANCGRSHTANSLRSVSRHKADIKARQEKKTREKRGKEKVQASNASDEAGEGRREERREERGEERGEEREEEWRKESLQPETEMDLEDERLAPSPKAETPRFDEDESQDHTKKF